jgi:quinone-modifying oxidoreductase subunit QmoB
MADEKKVGAYLCKGCGLGDRLNIDNLKMIAELEGKANLVREHDFLCSAEGVKLIQDDIDNEGVTNVAICACSRRAKTEAFNFEGIAITRGNLREGVIWVRPDTGEAQETTQEMAADYVRMACFESRFTNAPAASEQQGRVDHVLVVGGGVTGMTSAIEIAKAGYKATIVEKSSQLGGHLAAAWKDIPSRSPYADPVDTDVEDLVTMIAADPNITVHLNATISRTSGAPGRFAVDISTESGSTTTENYGAIVQASGFKDYDANQLPELGYGKTPDVVTQAELEKLAIEADGGPIKRPSDGKEVNTVAFIQCAGQRSEKEGHLPYCSGNCCLNSIKQAMYFKDRNSDIDTILIYSDLRTPGAPGEDFYRSGQQKGVVFTKGQVSEVEPGSDAHNVKFKDLILDEDTVIEADLVVLATGQVPNSGPDMELEDQKKVAAEEAGEEYVSIPVESILNLDYRQGPDVPQLVHGFTDSHFICFPYETRRTGIYTAGTLRRPMDSAQAREDGTGAAMKAIHALEDASRGRAAHPRSGDLSYPQFRKEGCTQCKRCTVECPFGAINEDEARYPFFNEARCRRCGICMGACPVSVISFENYSVDTVGQQIKNVDMPDDLYEKPRILVLACENDAYPALDMAARNGYTYSEWARVIPVRCLGSVNTIWISDALNAGYDGIVLMGCRSDDDYQCHFVRGSRLAGVHMSRIDDTLSDLNLEPERVETYEVAITDVERAPKLINDMAETVEKVGVNPFKF